MTHKTGRWYRCFVRSRVGYGPAGAGELKPGSTVFARKLENGKASLVQIYWMGAVGGGLCFSQESARTLFVLDKLIADPSKIDADYLENSLQEGIRLEGKGSVKETPKQRKERIKREGLT